MNVMSEGSNIRHVVIKPFIRISFKTLIGIFCILVSFSMAGVTGVYTQTSGTGTLSDTSISATGANQSCVLVSGGTLNITGSQFTKTGNTTSMDSSNFYGNNGGILGQAGTTINIVNCNIKTSAKGSNGVFTTGAKAVCYMTNDTITCDSAGGHGVDATVTGTMYLKNVVITTHGNGAAGAISTDKGNGTILCTLVVANTTGTGSPAIYSTGDISAVNCVLTATGSSGGVIEGSNSITLVNSTMEGIGRGVLLYQSGSGDANGANPTFSITGGSFKATSGPLFYTTNAASVVTAKGAVLTASSDTFMRADSNKWGTSGSNGGIANFTADSQSFSGYIVADAYGTIHTNLKNSSSYSGAINPSNKAKSITLDMDATSKWSVTADSYIDTMINAGISGTTALNITGNNHNVFYNSTASSSLGGKTYTLAGGGCLLPEGSTCSNTGIDNEQSRAISVSPLFSIMTGTGHVAFSPLYSNKIKTVGLYDLAGKQLSVKTFKKNQVNVRADFGVSDGAYIVKIIGIK